jgi:hypothetical protein
LEVKEEKDFPDFVDMKKNHFLSLFNLKQG